MANVERAIKNLRKNDFEAEYFSEAALAAKWLAEQMPKNSLAAFGGSETVYQIGLPELLLAKDIDILDFWQVPFSEARELYRRAFDADAYFCSANAITEDGFYLNVDGVGNRTASTIYGPKRLFIIAGINKIVPDVEAAFARLEECAPKNCIRMQRNTPCVKDNLCHDCDSQDRACRVYVLTKRPARTMPTTIVLIDDNLGF